jgi:hypothetical protein
MVSRVCGSIIYLVIFAEKTNPMFWIRVVLFTFRVSRVLFYVYRFDLLSL